MPPRVYYFGCIRECGHFWWMPEGADGADYKGVLSAPRMARGPERDVLEALGPVDGTLAPVNRTDSYDQHEGKALLHERYGVTLLAFWDRSVDKRHGSNSVFAVEGKHDFATMVATAKKAFPGVWSRFTFEVVPCTTS